MAAICDIGLLVIFINSVIGSIRVSLNELDITDLRDKEAVMVIEGDHILLHCNTDHQNSTISWHKNSAIILNATLEIHDAHLQDTGIYICRVTGANINESKNVYVDVLYPPSYPVIEGASLGLIGEPVNLKCVSDGNPEPSYEWRLEKVDGELLIRNQSYETTIPHDDHYKLVCKVQSKMVTTFGKTRNVTLSRTTSIQYNIKANVQYVKDGNHWRIHEGKDVYIECGTAGKPNPKVWWTKVGDDNFRYEGIRLKEYNTGIEFAGDYVCHAENTVTTVNGTVITTHDTETITVTIIASPDVASKEEEYLSCCNQSAGTTTVHTQMFTSNNQITTDYSNKTEQILFLLSGIGWTALVFSVVINVWLYRKNITIDKKYKNYLSNNKQINSNTNHSVYTSSDQL